jgi:PAS domain S-box-containing protein
MTTVPKPVRSEPSFYTSRLLPLILIGLTIVPFFVVAFFLFDEINPWIRFTEKEKTGLQYHRQLQVLLSQVQEHRGLVQTYLAGEKQFMEKIPARDIELKNQISVIDKLEIEFSDLLQTRNDWPQLKEQLGTISGITLQMDLSRSFELHTLLCNRILALMDKIIDNSNLILDPQLTSYYSMQILTRIPVSNEYLGQARGMGLAMAAQQHPSVTEKNSLLELSVKIREEKNALSRSFDIVLREGGALQAELKSDLAASAASTASMLQAMDKGLLNAKNIGINPLEYLSIASQAINDQSKLYQTIAISLGGMLQHRIDDYNRKKYLVIAFIFIVLTVASLIYLLFIRIQDKRRQTDEKNRAIFHDLKQSEAFTQNIILFNPDAVIVIDEQGGIDRFNPAAEKIFGYKAEEVINKNINILMTGHDHHRHDDYLKNFVRSGNSRIIGHGPREVVGKHKNGTHLPLGLTVGEITNTDRRLFIGTLRDISKRKQIEAALHMEKEAQKQLIEKLQQASEQLLQADKMASIGQLAAGVAHEINNPVGYINSNLGSLKKYLDDLLTMLGVYEQAEALITDERQKQVIQAMKQQIDLDFLRRDMQALLQESTEGVLRVKQIVQDLKDFSHVDEAEWQWADLRKGLDSTLNIVWNELKYKAEVIKEYGDIPDVECIASQLNQVFMNLLVNAGHAIEGRGTITLRTGTDGSGVYVEIADTGKGMSAEIQKRIFEPFYTTKPVGKGTGLGLSLAYGIVQKHHGRILVQSKVDHGTTLRIWIPVKQSHDAQLSQEVIP